MSIKYMLVLAPAYAPILLASYGSDTDFVRLSTSEIQRTSYYWLNDTSLICKRDDSPSLEVEVVLPSSEDLVYKFDQVTPTGKLEPFRNGFYKSTCFHNPTDDGPKELCIFVNPSINQGQGMVIVTPTELFERKLNNGIDLSDDPPNPGTVQVVDMPEKGGKGALATRDLKTGDYIAMSRPVALLPGSTPLWETPLGRSIRRKAIDHLPLLTRAEVATYHGVGDTEDEYISSLVDMNVFGSEFSEDESLEFGALVLEPARLNHACRPNVVYYLDEGTQMLYMRALEPVAKGEELTINYREYELPRQERRDILEEAYGFNCTCSHCQMSEELGKLSDNRVARISELLSIAFFDLSVDEAEEMVNLCETEKIPPCIAEASFAAAKIYRVLGNLEKVREHAEVARNMGILTLGLGWENLDGVEELLSLSTS
ncbi:hypothetical protein PGTUg99_013734 [Puccinia graminis f. sp. tritici]|uniref:SET domain-containing protein n=1 Tax=Puccinia graminis f. sp. tritici TaxID=56615 RepID=A0A5B0MQ71_PUCGR|nr:hypothetical protein PGTUg99_013734 [Puccinia graminis f. sp. tritici]